MSHSTPSRKRLGTEEGLGLSMSALYEDRSSFRLWCRTHSFGPGVDINVVDAEKVGRLERPYDRHGMDDALPSCKTMTDRLLALASCTCSSLA
jgi:hypothetical protein